VCPSGTMAAVIDGPVAISASAPAAAKLRSLVAVLKGSLLSSELARYLDHPLRHLVRSTELLRQRLPCNQCTARSFRPRGELTRLSSACSSLWDAIPMTVVGADRLVALVLCAFFDAGFFARTTLSLPSPRLLSAYAWRACEIAPPSCWPPSWSLLSPSRSPFHRPPGNMGGLLAWSHYAHPSVPTPPVVPRFAQPRARCPLTVCFVFDRQSVCGTGRLRPGGSEQQSVSKSLTFRPA
jgi:hypothetical protein